MAYHSIADFRSALDSVVNGARSNPFRARRNMAWPKIVKTPMGDIEVSSMAETMEALQSFPGSRVVETSATPAAVPPSITSLAGRGGLGVPQPAPQHARRAPRPFTGQLRDPSGPLTFNQARIIGMSVGGMSAVCPRAVTPKGTVGPSFHDVLAPHVTKEVANKIIDEMKQAGVDRPHPGVNTSQDQRNEAMTILMVHARIVCPLP